jgi:trimeric autotransporter adhesin
VSDQTAVTTAQFALSNAQANLTSATLKSSIAGTVGSLTLVKGASNGGMNIVVVGTGAVEVTVNVPLASMASVRVGQTANVTPQGATSSAPGSVISISLLPSTAMSTNPAVKATTAGAGSAQASATSSSPVYPMVVLVLTPCPRSHPVLVPTSAF